jgi:hypothetical protein
MEVPSMQALVAEVLSAWREADRAAGESPPGTCEHDTAVLASERLRALYSELTANSSTRLPDDHRLRALLERVRLPRESVGSSAH